CSHSFAAGTVESQSTMLPIMLNRYASNAPIAAVSNTVATSHARCPREQIHRNAKKRRGGVVGCASGNGSTSRSNHVNTRWLRLRDAEVRARGLDSTGATRAPASRTASRHKTKAGHAARLFDP